MHIRDAKNADEDALLHLMVQVQDLHHQLSPERYKKADPEALRPMVQGALADAQVIVAESDIDEVVGYAKMTFHEAPGNPVLQPMRWMQLDQMGVLAHARREGVGRALMHEAVLRSRARGASYVQLGVSAKNTPAIAYYRKTGFVVDRQTMTRPV